jgi:hypothetical protein
MKLGGSPQKKRRYYMYVVKVIGFIFLAVYLILTGLAAMSEINLTPMAKYFVDVCAIVAGVLVLISIGRFIPHKTV